MNSKKSQKGQKSQKRIKVKRKSHKRGRRNRLTIKYKRGKSSCDRFLEKMRKRT